MIKYVVRDFSAVGVGGCRRQRSRGYPSRSDTEVFEAQLFPSTMRYKLHPQDASSAEILLFRNVSNAKDILSLTLTGEIPAALLQARLVPDLFPALIAASKAVQDVSSWHVSTSQKERAGTMSTRNLFIEIIYNLSGSRNIGKALKTFGIKDDTTDILVIVPNPQDGVVEKIRRYIKAEEKPAAGNCLKHIVDENTVKKVYGISEMELECGTLVDSVVTRMACRDVK
ncbi:hypothetical protein FGB62_111g02 [Gracilaria domingensis]|nr:hypothetical protein FGB62_111g02 [Gracilaria domingensis]